MGMEGITMDYLLSDPFMAGVISTVVGLLVLVTVLPALTRRPSHPRQREWRVIEPAEQLPTITAKRIEAK